MPGPAPTETDAVKETRPFLERRRSRRRRLQEPCEVRLHGTGDDLAWTCGAALLNVSPEGMACRIDRREARNLCVDETLVTVFRLGAFPTAFDLKARITNITPAGTADQWVLGLEFVDDETLSTARAALRDAIAQAPHSKG